MLITVKIIKRFAPSSQNYSSRNRIPQLYYRETSDYPQIRFNSRSYVRALRSSCAFHDKTKKKKKRKISCSSLIWRATVPRISSRRAIVTLYRFTRGQHWHSTPGIVGYFSYCLSSFNIKFLRATRRLSRALIAGTGRNFRFRNCENVQWTQSGYFSSSIIHETKERSRSRSFFLETITALLFFHGREIFRFLSQLPQSTQAAAKYHPPWKNSILLSLHRDKGSPRYGAHEYLEKLRKNSAPPRGRNRTWRDVTFTIQCNLNAIRGEGNSPLPSEFEFLSR